MLLKNVREKNNAICPFYQCEVFGSFDLFYAQKTDHRNGNRNSGCRIMAFSFLGTEFLPQLNEGSIYIRATLPQSISLDESVTLANKMKKTINVPGSAASAVANRTTE